MVVIRYADDIEAVSAMNLLPINDRAEPFSIRLTDQFGFEWARAP